MFTIETYVTTYSILIIVFAIYFCNLTYKKLQNQIDAFAYSFYVFIYHATFSLFPVMLILSSLYSKIFTIFYYISEKMSMSHPYGEIAITSFVVFTIYLVTFVSSMKIIKKLIYLPIFKSKSIFTYTLFLILISAVTLYSIAIYCADPERIIIGQINIFTLKTILFILYSISLAIPCFLGIIGGVE